MICENRKKRGSSLRRKHPGCRSFIHYSFIHLLTYSFNRYLWSAYYVPGAVLCLTKM